jgi:hypothetical protein
MNSCLAKWAIDDTERRWVSSQEKEQGEEGNMI